MANLVLTRRPGERIAIGNDVVVTLVKTKGQAARLLITAPPTVPIVRSELLEESRKRDVKAG